MQEVIKRIHEYSLEEIMGLRFGRYSKAIIQDRALPDVRDGLKPVHRRVLYAMHELNLVASAKFTKSAAVVGTVMKDYHPHGDMAIYDTLVRMAQNFSMRYPLVDGHGNFGSVDGDPPAQRVAHQRILGSVLMSPGRAASSACPSGLPSRV